MCFYKSDLLGNQEVKIADEDIICYKLLQYDCLAGFISPYRHMTYFNNDLESRVVVRAKFCLNHADLSELDDGIHSYSSELQAWKNQQVNVYIFRARIPKGTQYYYNEEFEEYISEELIVIQTGTETKDQMNIF